jgi:predicted lipoprotein with Yx(FWY)xxD motif
MSDSRMMDPDDQSDHRSKAGVVRSQLRRRATRPMVVGIVLVAGGLLAAACGGATTASTPGAKSSSTHSSTHAAATAPPVSKTMTGTLGTYLVNAAGMTLYHFTPDTAGMSNCNGACATAWPPLTIASTTAPTAASGVMGTLGTIARSDGSMQVTYNGSPLYTFGGDKAPGDTNGQGLMGKWFVQTVKAGAAPTTSPSSRTGTSSGGYGY